MKKILLLLLIILPINVFAIDLPNLNSNNAIVYDLTDNELLEQKGDNERTSIASLTKITTAIVAIENIDNIDETFIVEDYMLNGIPWDASVAGFKVGDTISYRDALYGTLLPSGADATYILAYKVAGSVPKFVELMNKKAEFLEMNNTNYENVTGLESAKHYSTPYDVLTILKYALKDKTFKKIYTSKKYETTNGLKFYSTSYSIGKKLEIDTSRILGSKTGFTNKAGTCISAYFESNGHEFLLITLKAPSDLKKGYHVHDALALINYIDESYGEQILVEKSKEITKIKVNLSTTDEIIIKPNNNITKYLRNDYDKSKVSYEYDGLEEINYNYDSKKSLGRITYYYNGEIFHNEYVYLDKVLKADYKEIFNTYKVQIIVIVLSVLFLITIVIYLLKKSLK